MKKQIAITLFGAAGTRTLEITPRDGFPTRHIKVSASSLPSKPQTETKFPPVDDKSETVPPPSLFEVLRWMETSEDCTGWLIIDEILFVATTLFKMTFNHNTLLDALRLLYQQGCLQYRLNRFDQHTFRLIENQEMTLKSLLAEVDTILKEGGNTCPNIPGPRQTFSSP